MLNAFSIILSPEIFKSADLNNDTDKICNKLAFLSTDIKMTLLDCNGKLNVLKCLACTGCVSCL